MRKYIRYQQLLIISLGILFVCSSQAQTPSATPSNYDKALAAMAGTSTNIPVGNSTESDLQLSNIVSWQNQINTLQDSLKNATTVGQAEDIKLQIGKLQSQQQTALSSIKSYEDKQAADAEASDPCKAAAAKAVSSCSILDPGTQAALNGTLAQASSMAQQGGTAGTCKAAKLVQTVAAGANFALAAVCETSISSCKAVCKKEQADPKTKAIATTALTTCSAQEGKVIASGIMGLQSLMATSLAQKCEDAAANPVAAGPTPEPMDCTNPMMAGMPQCVCAANPHDPVCSGSNLGLGDGGGFSSLGSTAPTDPNAKDMQMPTFDDEIGKGDPGPQGAPSTQASSGGAGAMNGGSGAAPLPPEETGGPGKGPYNTDIMGGLTGGSGGGGGYYGGSSGSGDGGGKSMFESLAEKFNLKKFLPSKGDFKNRGIASGGGADGITGPNGPSLFEKVSSRYHKKQSELLP